MPSLNLRPSRASLSNSLAKYLTTCGSLPSVRSAPRARRSKSLAPLKARSLASPCTVKKRVDCWYSSNEEAAPSSQVKPVQECGFRRWQRYRLTVRRQGGEEWVRTNENIGDRQ